jgi:DNA polymerase III alpha subunit
MRYASLHNHTWYTFLEGAESPAALAPIPHRATYEVMTMDSRKGWEG